jgi:hypothetical protein
MAGNQQQQRKGKWSPDVSHIHINHRDYNMFKMRICFN